MPLWCSDCCPWLGFIKPPGNPDGQAASIDCANTMALPWRANLSRPDRAQVCMGERSRHRSSSFEGRAALRLRRSVPCSALKEACGADLVFLRHRFEPLCGFRMIETSRRAATSSSFIHQGASFHLHKRVTNKMEASCVPHLQIRTSPYHTTSTRHLHRSAEQRAKSVSDLPLFIQNR